MTTTVFRSAQEINSSMSRVYTHMMMAVLTSFVVSLAVSSSPALMAFFFTGIMKWITVFLPLVAVIGITIALNAYPSKSQAIGMLHGFAAIMGLSFSAIFVVYTSVSIFMSFLSAAILFGTLSVYGYFTKRSLDNWFQFLFIGLIAVVIASIVNVFLGSSVLTMVVSSCAIIVFLGLTAYDTQKIRETLQYNGEQTGIAEVTGALTLYLNFINIFLSLLQLLGGKRE